MSLKGSSLINDQMLYLSHGSRNITIIDVIDLNFREGNPDQHSNISHRSFILFPKMPIDLAHKNVIPLHRGYSREKKISRT